MNLARKRTVTFWNRKIVLVSTPTNKGASRIETAYEESDQRQYHVPCPECGAAAGAGLAAGPMGQGAGRDAPVRRRRGTTASECDAAWPDEVRWARGAAGALDRQRAVRRHARAST